MPITLVIDDEPLMRNTIRRMLEGAGHRVVEADNGRRGLAAIEKMRFDVVVTDIIMPEMEGVETVRAIRTLAPGLPIVAMSGGGRLKNDDFLRIAECFGANQTLRKPFSKDELIAALERAMETPANGPRDAS